MNADEARDKLMDLLYGELDDAERRAVEERIRQTPELQEEYRKLRIARSALAVHRAGEPATAPQVKIGGPIAARLRLRTLRRASALTAAAAILIAMGLWLLGGGELPPAIAESLPPQIERTGVSLTILSTPEDRPGYAMPTQPAYPMPVQRKLRGRYAGWGGLTLVRDQRIVRNLPAGETAVRFTDVPAGILPDTVRLRSLDHPGGLAVLEQNYQYDLASAAAVLKRHIDKTVTVTLKDGGGPASGKLLSFDERTLVIAPEGEGPRTITRDQVKAIVFEKLPEGLLTRPTLVWDLKNAGARRQRFEVAYLTSGLTWRADYLVKLHLAKGKPAARRDEKAEMDYPEIFDAADLVGYATVTNNSGVSFADAQLKLLAGDVNLIRDEIETLPLNRLIQRDGGGGGGSQFQEKSFFEYHLYTLGRATTLRSAETKQIELVTAGPIKLRRAYVYDRRANATAARVVSEFKNAKANGLGKPLPKGVVRLYAPDPDGQEAYISQTTIDHTPINEKVRLPWGYAFDIACSAKKTGYRKEGTTVHESWEYRLRNHKDYDVTITVIVRVPHSTFQADCDLPWRVREVGIVEIDAPVKANAAVTVKFSCSYDTMGGGGLRSPHQERKE